MKVVQTAKTRIPGKKVPASGSTTSDRRRCPAGPKYAENRAPQTEERKIKNGPDPEKRNDNHSETQLEIAKLVSQMRVEHRVIFRRDPIPDIATDEEERQKEQNRPRQETCQILHLPPYNNSPTRIGRVVHNEPEEAPYQRGEEIEKGKQPRECELFPQLAACGSDATDDQRDQQGGHANSQESQQNPVDVPAFENFRLRNG